jgi:DNA-binding MarR family transcriptional regulator
MNRDNGARTDKRAAVEDAVRRGLRMYMTRATVFSYQVAEDAGLGHTDLHCLGLLQLQGPMSAGDLARCTGLTTSAITAVIDRLERSGLARREPDPADRRRVIVRLDDTNFTRRIVPLYAARSAGEAPVLARFTEEELAVVRDFLHALDEADG